MKAALFRLRMTKDPQENKGRRASWRPWITEGAGEPEISAVSTTVVV
jgi:hypothetical protein